MLGDLLQVSARMLHWAHGFPLSLRNPIGDQTQDENEKAGKQKVRFRAVVFDFPRFQLPRAASGASWLQRDADIK